MSCYYSVCTNQKTASGELFLSIANNNDGHVYNWTQVTFFVHLCKLRPDIRLEVLLTVEY